MRARRESVPRCPRPRATRARTPPAARTAGTSAATLICDARSTLLLARSSPPRVHRQVVCRCKEAAHNASEGSEAFYLHVEVPPGRLRGAGIAVGSCRSRTSTCSPPGCRCRSRSPARGHATTTVDAGRPFSARAWPVGTMARLWAAGGQPARPPRGRARPLKIGWGRSAILSKMAISAVLVMSVWAWVWAMGLKVRAVDYP